MTTNTIKCAVCLEPIYYNEIFPKCKITFGSQIIDTKLTKDTAFNFYETIDKDIELKIEFYGKRNIDSINNRQLEIKIKEISIMGITDSKFIHLGEYTPFYPEPWASQQQNIGKKLDKTLKNVDTLGWNGVWKLKINNPPFTWIQHTLSQGWIYPFNHLSAKYTI